MNISLFKGAIMLMGPELFELEGEFIRIVIEAEATYIVCKDIELCKSIIEKYEVGRSQDYYFITEDEANKRVYNAH